MPSYFISTAIIGAGAAAKHKAISCKYFTIISGEVNNCTQYGSQHTSQWHSVTVSLSTPVVVTLKMELGFLLMFSPGVENDTFFLQIDILLEVRQNVGKYWNELQYYKSWRGDRAEARNILILFFNVLNYNWLSFKNAFLSYNSLHYTSDPNSYQLQIWRISSLVHFFTYQRKVCVNVWLNCVFLISL